MFRIETYVGPKYGNWKAGEQVYDTCDAASKAIDWHRKCEIHVGATRMKRRVVPA